MDPIIIAGFGRSGTTWISDIISKTLGALILFEPDHPLIFNESKDAIYNAEYALDSLKTHIHSILKKENRNPWLLRNHLYGKSNTSDELIDMIWENSDVIGFKSIRWNHNLPTLNTISNNKLIFLLRHPLSVVASLLKRKSFFLEFDWDIHWNLFKERNPFHEIDIRQYDDSEISIKYAVMWSISNIKALQDLDKMGLPHWPYEDYYYSPYKTTTKMLDYLGYENVRIHPAYLFYPSMSTLKTFHTDRNWPQVKKGNSRLFWKDTLSEKSAEQILFTVKEISLSFPNERRKLENLNYLKT